MTAILRAVGLGFCLLVAAARVGRAEDRTIALSLGAASTITLAEAFETVLIGDAHVVDVQARDNCLVTLQPLALGTTNLIFVDDGGRVITNILVVVSKPGA
jgi:Flp pilus assembly secretin CpaC